VDQPLLTKLARLPARALILLVRGYRFFLSPWLGSACRFEPTCSAYSLQALDQHGAAAGTYLTLHRLVRCGPWCPGGHDPVPEQLPRLFAGLFTRSAGSTPPKTSLDKTAP
jgi:putative membrane protein insertion efficiency factor